MRALAHHASSYLQTEKVKRILLLLWNQNPVELRRKKCLESPFRLKAQFSTNPQSHSATHEIRST